MGKKIRWLALSYFFLEFEIFCGEKLRISRTRKCNTFQKKSKYNSIKIHLPEMVRNCKYYISCRKNICLRIFIEFRTNYNIPLCVAV